MRGRIPAIALFALVGAACALLAFHASLRDLMGIWDTQEEYSFGYMVPLLSLFLLWRRRGLMLAVPVSRAYAGTLLVALGLAMLAVGRLGTLGTVEQYGFLCAIFGLCWSMFGWQALRPAIIPLALLAFMVPLPNYFLRELSASLQLVSSSLGMMLIRAFGISVHLEGNVIDLGTMRLQVIEACSGLRYLFSLLTIGAITAYLFHAVWWKRALVFVSAIPIAVFMNSLRIGVIGVLVEFFGRSMAEGFMHDFEGWVVFLVCIVLLMCEVAVLVRVGHDRSTLADAFVLDDAPVGAASPWIGTSPPASGTASVVLLAVAACVALLAPAPSHQAPPREPLSGYALQLGDWRGQGETLNPEYQRILKQDDYLLASFTRPADVAPINFYVSYYAMQANGNSVHSPRACIPGDGWEILDIRRTPLTGVDKPVELNRVLIQRGESKQLVYYWFQQRGEIYAGEYTVKLGIVRDAITRGRSDGAMVRLVSPVLGGESIEQVDARMQAFARLAIPSLKPYVPD